MTLAEYMDPVRFPRTTQHGLTAKEQLAIDAFHYDQIKDMIKDDEGIDKEERERWTELEEKMRFHADLEAELA